MIDLDATLVTAHSDREDARRNFKGGFGHHPLGAWPDNSNEALAMVLRPGNAGSNTTTDHLVVLERALTQIPDRWRCRQVLIRADGAGYSHALITALASRAWTSPSATRDRGRPRRSPSAWAWQAATTPTAARGNTPT